MDHTSDEAKTDKEVFEILKQVEEYFENYDDLKKIMEISNTLANEKEEIFKEWSVPLKIEFMDISLPFYEDM